jgi:hypothetical protein
MYIGASISGPSVGSAVGARGAPSIGSLAGSAIGSADTHLESDEKKKLLRYDRPKGLIRTAGR